MEYEYYRETYKGSLTEEDFDQFIDIAEDLVLCYVHDLASIQYTDKPLEYFGDFNRALCYEVDLLNSQGMEAIMNEPSDKRLSSIKTSGFTISYSNQNARLFALNGMPFHPMTRSLIEHELRKNGFMNRVIPQ